MYKKIYDRTLKEIQNIYHTIRSNSDILYTLETEKHALVNSDRKRYWIDREITVGHVQPSIEKTKTC